MNIRRIEEKDIKRLEYICLATANEACNIDDKAKQITLYKYNRYYTRASAESCFALCDDSDTAVGYILCATDYKSYKKSFCKNELVNIGRYGLKEWLTAFFEVIGSGAFKKSYPAHLHIDILPEYQHCGWGGQLISKLSEHLQAVGVSGVMLAVGIDNKNAISFYQKNGFEILLKTHGAYIMGRKIKRNG